ncbi:MAG TPA: N,N-dimethylformamidase beta subunit family domain-containing protein [Actinomycetes bacterium]|nr:N,N-dimethylformamidase beta subunit family domain-containing protein [Actinomycetes bacterium]
MTIDGYADRLSYAVGDVISLCCSTTAEKFSVEVARVGGSREIVWRAADIAGVVQPVPSNASAVGCGWTPTVQFEIPRDWRSGYYEVILRTRDAATGRDEESLAFFALRHTEQPHDRGQMLLVLATNTYNAYNDWGGPSLYTGAVRVSFQRPMARGFLRKPEPYLRYPNLDDVQDPEHERFRNWADQHGLARWSGSSGWYQWERLFVQWAERAGYTVDVAVNADLEQRPEIVNDYKLVVSVGHDEYWSWGMRDTAEAFIERGGNYAFLSGNSVCWQVRYEDDGRTMVGYKADAESDPLYGTDEQHLVSTLWCSQLVNRPENHLTGVSFSRGGYIRMGQAVPRASGGLTAWRPDHWVFKGCDLHYGDVFGAKDAIAVYEVDGCEFTLSTEDGLPVPTGRDGTPSDFTILATAPARLWTQDELPSRYRSSQVGELEFFAASVFGEATPENAARLTHNHAVMGVYTRGGTVFTSGVTDWVYGLAGHDPVVSQVTRNVLDRLTT